MHDILIFGAGFVVCVVVVIAWLLWQTWRLGGD